MSLLDMLRQEYLQGKVVDKYRLGNGNVGLILENGDRNRRYHVEFKDRYEGPGIENLFGLLKYPFEGKTENVERLVSEGDYVELTVSYSKGPIREAYFLHSVSRVPVHKNEGTVLGLPSVSYKPGAWGRYYNAPH